jgi:hypothetical protein
MDASVAAAVTTRYRLPSSPVFLKDPQSCSPPALSNVATVPVASLKSGDFFGRYPLGVFVLCNVNDSGTKATATLERLLFHAATGTIKVSESGTITLTRTHGGWRVSGWDMQAVEYL